MIQKIKNIERIKQNLRRKKKTPSSGSEAVLQGKQNHKRKNKEETIE